jgi:hypothetical protein
MEQILILAITASLALPLPESANAQSSVKSHSSAKSKINETGGVETIKPQEESKVTGEANGWSGTYVGVNAGGGFGATAGTNVMVPFGTSAGKSEK